MTTPRELGPLQLLGTHGDLAHLFGLGSSALSNWRARHPDFPRPVNTDGRTAMYDLDAVLDWARRPDTPARLQPNPAWWWRRAVESLRVHVEVEDDIPGDPLRSYLAALVLVHAVLTGSARGMRPSVRLVGAIRSADDAAVALVDVAAQLEAQNPPLRELLVGPLGRSAVPGPIVLDLLDRLDAAAAELLAPSAQLEIVLAVQPSSVRDQLAGFTTDESLAALVAGAAVRGEARVIYDPCAGEGGLVVACARALPGEVHAVVQELDENASRIARTRFLLEGLTVEVGRPGRSSLGEDQFPGLRADLVVADPPVSPRSPLVDWVDHGLAHLAAGGRAVVVLPAHALVVVKSARRMPEPDLVERVTGIAAAGKVASVTIVPSRLRRDVSGPLTIFELLEDGIHDGLVSVRWPTAVWSRSTTSPIEIEEDDWRQSEIRSDELFGRLNHVIREQSVPSPPAPTTPTRADQAVQHDVPELVLRAFDNLSSDLRPLLDRLGPELGLDRDEVRRQLDYLRDLLRPLR